MTKIAKWTAGAIAVVAMVTGLGIVSSMLWTTLPVTRVKASSVQTSEARALADQLSLVFEDAANRVGPSVVPIFAEAKTEVTGSFSGPGDLRDFFGDDFFRRFFGQPGQPQTRVVRSMGSGVIVSDKGYILTNNHVVGDADKLTVVLEDDKKYDAKVIGTDPATDLAVIQIDAPDLHVAALGDSDAVKVGQWVIAVGNPFQLLHTVTAGIISAKGRSSIGAAAYEDFIQTDASINPGNSGGPLADLDGNVIGINTLISTPSGGNVGIGFAIPINMAKGVMDQLLTRGKVTRGYLGLLPQDIDEDLAKALKLGETKGVLVGDVTPDMPADKAGIKRGDVILRFDGKPVKDSDELRRVVAQMEPGSPVRVDLLRDGTEQHVSVTLAERPQEADNRGPAQAPKPETSEKLGLSAQTLTADIARQLGFENEKGAVVANVAPGSVASDAGLRRGDLIKEVNRQSVETAEDLDRMLNGLSSGDTAALLVRRGPNTFFLALPIP